MSSSRLFVIGLDAGDKDLIDRWSAEGYLPNFSKLLETSLWGDIDNPRGLEAGSVWPTFYFGLRPGNMGQHDGARLFMPEEYEHRSFRPEKDDTPPIWSALSDAGKLCGVIDVPYNYPVNSVNGMKVVDRAGHVPAGGGDFLHLRTHPPELAEEIVELFGPDPSLGRSSDFLPLGTVEEVNEFRRVYSERIRKKADMILHYWQQKDWDFFLSVFTDLHCAGHRCWFLHDPTYHQHNAELAAAAGNPLRDIYIELDKAIGRMMEAVGDQARFMVYSSHGMGPRHSGTRLLDRMLAKMDNRPVATRSGFLMNLARRIWRLMPEFMRKPFLRMRENITSDGFQPNRAGRRFFEVYANDRTAGVRINLQGREPQGMVSEAEYDQLCDWLMTEISELKNPDTGKPVVREIIKTRDLYSGPYRERLPDLLVTWDRSDAIIGLQSEKYGDVTADGLDIRTRTGDHRIKGRFFALAQEWPHQKLEQNVHAEDFAPTFAALFGVSLAKTDGKAIQSLVSPNTPEGISGDLALDKQAEEVANVS